MVLYRASVQKVTKHPFFGNGCFVTFRTLGYCIGSKKGTKISLSAQFSCSGVEFRSRSVFDQLILHNEIIKKGVFSQVKGNLTLFETFNNVFWWDFESKDASENLQSEHLDFVIFIPLESAQKYNPSVFRHIWFWSQIFSLRHSSISLQVIPFPSYPALHWHSEPPGASTHTAIDEHRSTSPHESKSDKIVLAHDYQKLTPFVGHSSF